MGVELTDEQIELKREIKHWYKTLYKPYYYYSGAAGTGKTTVIQSVISDMGLADNEIISAAYVGKAVLVLMRHGLKACTIHSLIYTTTFVSEKTLVMDENGNIHHTTKRKMKFVLKDRLDPDIRLIIVDESGMVNDKMREEILSFGIPLVMLGDMNQLPPVFGKSSILDTPDFILTKIMRQAEGDPIVYLSQCILNDIPLKYGNYGLSNVVSEIDISRKLIEDYDMIICAKNKTRDHLNTSIREEILHRYTPEPMIGEKMICRQNNWDECINGIYLTNGMVGYITDVDYSSLYRNLLYVGFRPDFMDEGFDVLDLDYKYLKTPFDEKKDFGLSDFNKFEFGYAITAHLSQGSEYNRVLFMDEFFHSPEMTKKLEYTAITRARDQITIVKKEPRIWTPYVKWDKAA